MSALDAPPRPLLARAGDAFLNPALVALAVPEPDGLTLYLAAGIPVRLRGAQAEATRAALAAACSPGPAPPPAPSASSLTTLGGDGAEASRPGETDTLAGAEEPAGGLGSRAGDDVFLHEVETEVASSFVAALAFQEHTADAGRLRTRLHAGLSVTYRDVPRALFERVRGAESVGQAFLREVAWPLPFDCVETAAPHVATALPRSTCLSHAAYDAQDRALQVTFRQDARTYTYHDVPVEVYARLVLAPSAGRAYNRYVKHHYAFSYGAVRYGAGEEELLTALGARARYGFCENGMADFIRQLGLHDLAEGGLTRRALQARLYEAPETVRRYLRRHYREEIERAGLDLAL